MNKSLSVLLILALFMGLFSSCATDGADSGDFSDGGEKFQDTVEEEKMPVEVDFSLTDEDMFSARDSKTDYDKDEAIFVELKGKGAKCDSDGVRISGSKVTLTAAATYVISGSLSDGMIVVDAEKNAKIHLIFDGVDITSRTSAALYILSADKVHVTLSEDTENTLENGGAFAALDENNIDGALFSKGDLTINGSGRLTVTSPAGHGIVCKD
ncbi:MAG: carbohydrate-binding domain-containing protein, partial [Clostridia bacterium]|nr:carbohydrate-binding domain-containing protein [Clostridia bacterium]